MKDTVSWSLNSYTVVGFRAVTQRTAEPCIFWSRWNLRKEVGAALKQAGVTQARRTIGGRKVRLYVLPTVQPDPTEPDIEF